MIWNLKISLPLLNLIIDTDTSDSTGNSEHKLYMSLWQKVLPLNPGMFVCSYLFSSY